MIQEISYNDFDLLLSGSATKENNDLEKRICQASRAIGTTHPMMPRTKFNQTEKKTIQAVSIAPRDVHGSARFDIEISWGGSEGPTYSGSVSGGVKDDYGNKFEIDFEVKDDGSAKIGVSGEYEQPKE